MYDLIKFPCVDIFVATAWFYLFVLNKPHANFQINNQRFICAKHKERVFQYDDNDMITGIKRTWRIQIWLQA